MSLGRGEDVLNWDRAGRPFAGCLGGATWHRALDGRMVEIETRDGGRHANWLADEPTLRWAVALRDWAERVVEAGRAAGADDIVGAFAPAAAFDAAAWEADARRFAAVYHPVPILPPDQYLSLVLQATIGCSWNRCTFCDFYRDRSYAVRPVEEFRAHADGVRAFFGAGLAVRRSIFLADANAIGVPTGRVVEWLRATRATFPVREGATLSCEPREGDPPRGFDGIHGFLDVPAGLSRSADEWAMLGEEGLKTVYLGLETAHAPLLELLGKPALVGEVPDLVRDLKAAGIAVGLIVLAGVGGRELAAAHESETQALVDALPLDRDDLVYVSPYAEKPGNSYRDRERDAGLTALDGPEAWAQARRMRGALRSIARMDGPRSAIYDVRLFAY